MSPSRRGLPVHVAIIMDGNGRWARRRGLTRIEGHREGARSVRAVVETARRMGVRYLTLYAFSTENWGRPTDEVQALMLLLGDYLESERALMMKQGIRLRAMGEIDRLPPVTRRKLRATMAATRHNRKMDLILALSYGGRQEILTAVNRVLAAVGGHRNGRVRHVTEAQFRRHLYAPDVPDPDLLIRTSGERRISNFLLWQSAYSELHLTDRTWPEFRAGAFRRAIADYARRERRYGLTWEQAKIKGGRA